MHLVDVNWPDVAQEITWSRLRFAVAGDVCPNCATPFEERRGMEMGHIFKLRYAISEPLQATFTDEDGSEKLIIMGCYGIGINRIAASAIETMYDKDGIIWPINIAPFEVIIVPAGNSEQIVAASEKLYEELKAAGVEVLLDDRDERGGVKFKDADLLGIPVRITIGAKSIAEGKAEIKLRRESEIKKIAITEIKENILKIIADLKKEIE
jgi:prolyl-tRNA synthetase